MCLASCSFLIPKKHQHPNKHYRKNMCNTKWKTKRKDWALEKKHQVSKNQQTGHPSPWIVNRYKCKLKTFLKVKKKKEDPSKMIQCLKCFDHFIWLCGIIWYMVFIWFITMYRPTMFGFQHPNKLYRKKKHMCNIKLKDEGKKHQVSGSIQEL